jgi:hypothetical protein
VNSYYIFDIENGVVKYRKGYSSDRFQSHDTPNGAMSITQTASKSLVAALENYAAANNGSSTKTNLREPMSGVSTNVNLSLAKLQLQFLNMGNEQEVKGKEQPLEVAQAITRTRESNNIGGL